MGSSDADRNKLTPDDRYAIAAMAAAAERANRPRAFVMIGMLIFAVACFYFLLGFRAYDDASRTRARSAAEYQRLANIAEEYQFFKQVGAEQTAAGLYCAPDPRLASTIRNIAVRVGIESPPIQDEATEQRDGVTRRRLRYVGVSDPSIEELLEFVDRVRTEVPCVRVYRLSIRPVRGTSWQMEVGFERLELAQ